MELYCISKFQSCNQPNNKPPLKPSLRYSQLFQKPHLCKIASPLSLARRVSIKKIIFGLYSWAFFWHCRIAKGVPSLLQFQLIILIVTGEVVEGQPPSALNLTRFLHLHSQNLLQSEDLLFQIPHKSLYLIFLPCFPNSFLIRFLKLPFVMFTLKVVIQCSSHQSVVV